MVGEIRDGRPRGCDRGGADGHLVFSTLHTNDAPRAVTRLIEMGIEPSSPEGRRFVHAGSRAASARALPKHLPRGTSFLLHCTRRPLVNPATAYFTASVTAELRQTGYRGRVGVFQLLIMSPRLEQLASEKSSRDVISEAARAVDEVHVGRRHREGCRRAHVAEELARVVSSSARRRPSTRG